jgi:hypothetical protein
LKYIITTTIHGNNYFLKEKVEKIGYKHTISWEGLTDNATKYNTQNEAELTITANGLDAKVEPFKT